MRQFISSENPDKKGILKIQGKDFRYLRQVLRLKVGDMFALRLPSGDLQNTTVCQIDDNARFITLQVCGDSQKSSITRGVQAENIQDECKESGVEYWLFQYIAKPVKMEQIIRQAVECGVKYILPIAGAYSQKQNVLAMQGAKKERIERIVREARQQSGSPVETEILAPLSTEEALEVWKKSFKSPEEEKEIAAAFSLWERNENTRRLSELINGKKKRIALAVGSEGGISPEEIKVLSDSGFATIHFAGNILRCETAALYGIAAVQSMYQEMISAKDILQ
ncbi:MAG: 16S rRNA (uracil(1498)-N(3))-methyltransferase [Treponema sp.]|nr:16S rRNA (uracil(1498)-N(3))-methyltransferase [Treponema sp.]